MKKITTYERAFNAFSQFPDGLACFEYAILIDGEIHTKPSAVLSLFVKEGLAEIAGTKLNKSTGHLGNIYKPTGLTFAKRKLEKRTVTRMRKRPTDSELVELRKFKKDAIARFPELGISTVIMTARKQIANIYRSDGNEAKAAMFENGLMDEGDAMRIAVAILERKTT
jgi:hypothetical protein